MGGGPGAGGCGLGLKMFACLFVVWSWGRWVAAGGVACGCCGWLLLLAGRAAACAAAGVWLQRAPFAAGRELSVWALVLTCVAQRSGCQLADTSSDVAAWQLRVLLPGPYAFLQRPAQLNSVRGHVRQTPCPAVLLLVDNQQTLWLLQGEERFVPIEPEAQKEAEEEAQLDALQPEWREKR